jgi:hypothetical protein
MQSQPREKEGKAAVPHDEEQGYSLWGIGSGGRDDRIFQP